MVRMPRPYIVFMRIIPSGTHPQPMPFTLDSCSLEKGEGWSEGEFALYAVLVYAILTADRARFRIIEPGSTSTEVEPWELKSC